MRMHGYQVGVWILALVLGLAGSAQAVAEMHGDHAQDGAATPAEGRPMPAAMGTLINLDGAEIGELRFIEGPSGVLIEIEARDLPPGPHGLHLHTVGSCADEFMASGGHMNPFGKKHGLLNPDGPEVGDLPNVYAAADGTLRAEVFNAMVSLSDTDRPTLFDADGTAVVLHAGADDHFTQPIGHSGGRIACAVVEAVE